MKIIPPTPTETFTPTITPTETFTETPSLTPTETLDPLAAFIKECERPGSPDVSCIYADGILALHLWRGDEPDIPKSKGAALLRNDAWNNGVVGIVAHDAAGGQEFYGLFGHVIIDLIRTDGTMETYGINKQTAYYTNWYTFTPYDGGRRLSGEEMMDLYFRGGNNFNKMTLQTCFGGNSVLFVSARRISTK